MRSEQISELLEQQESLAAQHLTEHFSRTLRYIPHTVDHSCLICFPRPNIVPVEFGNLWNWIEAYHSGKEFTIYTVQALPTYITAFKNDPNNRKCDQVVIIAIGLLLSITYDIKPDLPGLLFEFLNFTQRTNHFENPITVEIIQAFRDRLEEINNIN